MASSSPSPSRPANGAHSTKMHMKCSVVLGYTPVDYTSNAHGMNNAMLAAQAQTSRATSAAGAGDADDAHSPEKAPPQGKTVVHGSAKQHAASIQSRNKKCSVVLGDTVRDFSTTSKQQDPTGHLNDYTAKLNVDAKAMLRKTSACFGTDKAPFETTMGRATQWSKEGMQKSLMLRNETRRATAAASKSHSVSQENQIEYISEATRQFEDKMTQFKPSKMAEAVRQDLRASHFHLGYTPLDYSTSSHIKPLSPEQFAQQCKRADPPYDLRKSSIDLS